MRIHPHPGPRLARPGMSRGLPLTTKGSYKARLCGRAQAPGEGQPSPATLSEVRRAQGFLERLPAPTPVSRPRATQAGATARVPLTQHRVAGPALARVPILSFHRALGRLPVLQKQAPRPSHFPGHTGTQCPQRHCAPAPPPFPADTASHLSPGGPGAVPMTKSALWPRGQET